MTNIPKQFDELEDLTNLTAEIMEPGKNYRIETSITDGISRGGIFGCTRKYKLYEGQELLGKYAVEGCGFDNASERNKDPEESKETFFYFLNKSLKAINPKKQVKESGYGYFTCTGLVSLEGVVQDYQVLMNQRTGLYEVIQYMDIKLDPETTIFQQEAYSGETPRILIPFNPKVQKAKQDLRFGVGSELLVEILSETGEIEEIKDVIPSTAHTFNYVPVRVLRDDLEIEDIAETKPGQYDQTAELVAARKMKGLLFQTEDPEAVKHELLMKDMPEEVKPFFKKRIRLL